MLSNAYLAELVFRWSRIQGPNLPSMVLIASEVQVLCQITSTYGTLVFGPTYMYWALGSTYSQKGKSQKSIDYHILLSYKYKGMFSTD